MGQILELTGCFNRAWQSVLEQRCAGEPEDAVNSIVTNRHLIAHGTNVGISFHVLKNYYRSAIRVLEAIEDLCR